MVLVIILKAFFVQFLIVLISVYANNYIKDIPVYLTGKCVFLLIG